MMTPISTPIKSTRRRDSDLKNKPSKLRVASCLSPPSSFATTSLSPSLFNCLSRLQCLRTIGPHGPHIARKNKKSHMVSLAAATWRSIATVSPRRWANTVQSNPLNRRVFTTNMTSTGNGLQGSSDIESYSIREGLKVVERFFTVPLDYSKPDGEKIRIFARHVIPKAKASKPEDEKKLPFLLYLQGGPGFEIGLPSSSGYVGEIHEKGYQTLWLDQRGTGLSTPLSPDTLPEHVKTDEEIAAYLKHFRADNIVRDCEHIRMALLGDRAPEDQKWTILGQSFGGFCAITYLSFHSEGLKEVFLTGGLAPLVDQPDVVYQALVDRIIKRNEVYYSKYPQDIKRVREILAFLESNKVILPNGGHLTPSRFQQLGINFGMHGGIDSVHQLVFRASKDLEFFKKIAYKTLQNIQNQQTFDGNPLYAILHEPIYCQGQAHGWSAARTIQPHSQFSWKELRSRDEAPVYFTGEMVFPDMFDDYSNLRAWKGAADILSKDASWGPLYDLEKLGQNEVKVSAVTYFNDMFVDFNFSQQTAAKIKNTEQYITNQLAHDGIRKDSADVMKKLFKMSKREYD